MSQIILITIFIILVIIFIILVGYIIYRSVKEGFPLAIAMTALGIVATLLVSRPWVVIDNKDNVTPIPASSHTPIPPPTDTSTPQPTHTPTDTPIPPPTDTSTPQTTHTPTSRPRNTPTHTPIPPPTNTPTPRPTSTSTYTPTPIPGGIGTGIDNGELEVLLSFYEFRPQNHPENAPVELILSFANNTSQPISVQMNLLKIRGIDNIGTAYGEYLSAGARYCDNSAIGCVFGPNQKKVVEQLENYQFTVNANEIYPVTIYLTIEGQYYDQITRVDLKTDWIDFTVPIIQYRSDSFKQVSGKWRLVR